MTIQLDQKKPIRVGAMIPARGGSVGVPGKSLVTGPKLGGRPLIEWTIEAAKTAGLETWVNTDHGPTLTRADELGVWGHYRSADVATSDTSMLDTLKEFVATERLELDALIILYLTYPFRTAKHILSIIDAFITDGGRRPLIGIKPPDTHPYLCVTVDDYERPVQVIPHDRDQHYQRQQYPEMYELTHWACVVPLKSIPSLDAQLMGPTSVVYRTPRDHTTLDIDTQLDLGYARYLLAQSE